MTSINSPRSTPSVSRGYAVVVAGFLVQQLMQLWLLILLSDLFGATRPMDAFRYAATLPISLSALISTTIGAALIALTSRATIDNEDEGRRESFAAAVFWIVLLATLLLAGIMYPAAEWLMRSLHPGFDETLVRETAGLFHILLWLAPANVAIGLLQAMLNSRQNFVAPALAGALGPLATVLLVRFRLQPGIDWIAWATVIGAAVNIVVQLVPAGKMLWPIKPWWSRGNRAQWQALYWIAAPIFALSIVQRIDPSVDRYLLSSSLMPEGSLARLDWAYKVLTLFIMAGSGVLSTVAFPRLASKAALGPEEFGRETANALGMLLALCLPGLATIVLFSDSLIHDLLQRGTFTARDTELVARLLRLYAPMLVGAALGEVCGKILLARRDAWTPGIIGMVTLIIGFVVKLTWTDPTDPGRLALISSIVSLAGGLALLVLTYRSIGPSHLRSVVHWVLPSCIGTILVTLLGRGIQATAIPYAGLIGLIVGAVVYFAMVAAMVRRLHTP